MSILDLFRSKPELSLKEVSSRLNEIESQTKLLRLEWNEVYDKLAHALDRLSKRNARALVEYKTSPGNGADAPVTMDDLWKKAREKGLLR